MIVHEVYFVRTEDLDHLPRDPLATSVSVPPRQVHEMPVVMPRRRGQIEQHFDPLRPLRMGIAG